MQIDSSAMRTGREPASACEWATTVRMPISRQVRRTRSAISPRLAMRILWNIVRPPIRAHLLRWRPRLRAQRTESTPRTQPSGAASHLDLFAQPAAVSFARRSAEDIQRWLRGPEAGEDRGGGDAEVARGDFGEEGSEV